MLQLSGMSRDEAKISAQLVDLDDVGMCILRTYLQADQQMDQRLQQM